MGKDGTDAPTSSDVLSSTRGLPAASKPRSGFRGLGLLRGSQQMLEVSVLGRSCSKLRLGIGLAFVALNPKS